MTKKRALITGVTGQDGAYLAQFLLSKDYDVFGLFRRSSTPNFWRLQHLNVLDKIVLIPGDSSDPQSIQEAVIISDPDEIYNLAAQSYVGASFDLPGATLEVDAKGVLVLLEVIRQHKKDIKFYQASTSELYGTLTEVPQTEKTPFTPNSPYAAAKLYAFQMTRIYREAYGIFASNGILFNHESPLRGLEFVTRKIINSVVKIKMGIEKNLRLGNLEAKRDWGYAPEYVEGMWRILQADTPDDFVMATGKSHSVQEFVEEAFRLAGLDWKAHVIVDKDLMRPLDVNFLQGDPSKAKNVLNWSPKTELKDLVRIMYEAEMKTMESVKSIHGVHTDIFNYPENIRIKTRTVRE
ncbi:MAG: GDP-mannose 4,6-dehydratase [Pseudomonadota bacterium]